MAETSGACLSVHGAGAKEISQHPRPLKDQQSPGAVLSAPENLEGVLRSPPLVVPREWEWPDSSPDSQASPSSTEDNDSVLSRSLPSLSHSQELVPVVGFSFFKPISNLLHSIRKRYQQPLDMGNLQGGDKNKSGGKKDTSGSASPGRSRASKLLLGNRGKSPAKQKNAKASAAAAANTAATAAPSVVASPRGVTDTTAAAVRASEVTAGEQRTSGLLQQRSSQHLLPAPSRESSAESVFTDPLTSPINNLSATLAAASGSLTSSYYSDVGTLPRDDTMVRTAQEPDHSPPSLEERSPMVDVDNVTLTLDDPGSHVHHSLDALDEEEDAVNLDIMTRSVDTMDLGSPMQAVSPTTSFPARTASQGAFTLVRHRKVELPPATLPPEAAEYAQSELNLHAGECTQTFTTLRRS